MFVDLYDSSLSCVGWSQHQRMCSNAAPGVSTPTKSEEQLQEKEDALHGDQGPTKTGAHISNGASVKEVEMESVDAANGNGKVHHHKHVSSGIQDLASHRSWS